MSEWKEKLDNWKVYCQCNGKKQRLDFEVKVVDLVPTYSEREPTDYSKSKVIDSMRLFSIVRCALCGKEQK
ncbi:MAG: hypothetical protein GTO54_08025 [Nitrososphaeria archaeon]|nr:hypothetical protein [Nitrososphaeria archaeon]